MRWLRFCVFHHTVYFMASQMLREATEIIETQGEQLCLCVVREREREKGLDFALGQHQQDRDSPCGCR